MVKIYGGPKVAVWLSVSLHLIKGMRTIRTGQFIWADWSGWANGAMAPEIGVTGGQLQCPGIPMVTLA